MFSFSTRWWFWLFGDFYFPWFRGNRNPSKGRGHLHSSLISVFSVCLSTALGRSMGVLSSAAFRHCLPPAPGWPRKSHQPCPGLVWLQNFQGPLAQGIHSACSHLHLALPLACAYILLAKFLSCVKRSQTVRLRRSKDWIKNWCLGDPAVVWNLIQLK